MLGSKIDETSKELKRKVNVWLVNTGWSGGAYGEGARIELTYTRAIIKAALNGDLDNVPYRNDNIFELSIPTTCPDVPNAILNPRETWRNENEYDKAAEKLKELFNENYKKYQ